MLAIVAGEGDLPELVFQTLASEGTPFFLCEIEGRSWPRAACS